MTAHIEDKSSTVAAPESPTLEFMILKWAVILMGILLVAGFAVVIVTIVNRSAGAGKNEAQAPVVAGSGAGGTVIDLPVAHGADVTALDLDGSRLAITLKNPSGSEIAIIHLKSGKIIRRIKLIEK